MPSIKELEHLEELAKREYHARSESLRDAREQERADRLADIKPLVIRAHDLLCGYNHTDGCGWCYEISSTREHSWSGTYSAHARWLSRYDDLINGDDSRSLKPMSIQEITFVLDSIEELRKKCPNITWILRSGRLAP